MIIQGFENQEPYLNKNLISEMESNNFLCNTTNESLVPILNKVKFNANNPTFFQDFILLIKLKRNRNFDGTGGSEENMLLYEETFI